MTQGNLNNHIKQTNWAVPAGTQAMPGAFSFTSGWNRRLWCFVCL